MTLDAPSRKRLERLFFFAEKQQDRLKDRANTDIMIAVPRTLEDPLFHPLPRSTLKRTLARAAGQTF
jgi:hypothetical protein